jgi:DNA-damage-inducible protein J
MAGKNAPVSLQTREKGVDFLRRPRYNAFVKQNKTQALQIQIYGGVRSMSETTMVNFRMDVNLKREMESVCREMGLTMTSAINMFAAKVTRERRIPFEVTADPFYSDANVRHLSRVVAEIDSGAAKLMEHELIED